jgi:hypothetical protein
MATGKHGGGEGVNMIWHSSGLSLSLGEREKIDIAAAAI